MSVVIPEIGLGLSASPPTLFNPPRAPGGVEGAGGALVLPEFVTVISDPGGDPILPLSDTPEMQAAQNVMARNAQATLSFGPLELAVIGALIILAVKVL